MPNNDWSKFCKRISVRANFETIYHALSTQEGLESWFLRKAAFTRPNGTVRGREEHIQKGDTYLWLWHGYPDDVAERKQVLDANGNNMVQFTFTADCVVTIYIKNEAGETIVELWQEQIPFDDDPTQNLHVMCSEGWTFYLTNLKSILEGGIDLRNRNMQLSRVIN